MPKCFAAICVFLHVAGADCSPTEIIAHRGLCINAPENTLAAFDAAWAAGADGIETDVHLSKDLAVVCHHDQEIPKGLFRRLKIKSSSLEKIRKAFGNKNPRHQIPVLSQALETVPDSGKIFIEVKCGKEIIPYIKKALENSDLEKRQAAIISFDPRVILESKSQMSEIKALWLTRYKKERKASLKIDDAETLVQTALSARADGISFKTQKALNEDLVLRLRREGLEVHVWTVDDPAEALRYKNLGIDSVTTNLPLEIGKSIK